MIVRLYKSVSASLSFVNKQVQKQDNFFFDKVNPNIERAQYAVRGQVPTRALEIQQELAEKPGSYPFAKVVSCNIGNPQDLGFPPMTFAREVASCLASPKFI
jgi:alanine transaminase